ncbi:MAG TPA: sigma-54 dependent transcriptional regulator [Longimicrobiales bacterium]
MASERILVLDDDDLIRDVISERLERRGFDVARASSLEEARAHVRAALPDVALLDIRLPDGLGTDLMTELLKDDVPCVMMTAHATVESAVTALQAGASDYLEKPFSMDRLTATLGVTFERNRLRREVRALRKRGPLVGMVVGPSEAMERVMELVAKVAPAETATILLRGETGTGKGVLARALHESSPRADGPFVNITCSALAETLMESELFGHEKGAFTDARTMKRGLVEVAHEGTLFLDEIGELSAGVQGKLLRFIEEKTFRRVGGTRDLNVDTRIVAATNRNLEEDVAEGRFREDLYYRLSVLPIEIPPLRHRPSDIPVLAAHFLDSYSREFAKRVTSISPEAMEHLVRHPWPGNVRELRNVVERAVLLSEGTAIEVDTLPPALTRDADGPRDAGGFVPDLGPDGVDLEEMERALLREALRRSEGNRTEAGRLLGLSRHQIRNRLQKYGQEPGDDR